MEPHAKRQRGRAFDLPPELWLTIFSFLDYETLKTLLTVNKQFRALLTRRSETSRTAIDSILFRDHASKTLPDKTEFRIHPFLGTTGIFTIHGYKHASTGPTILIKCTETLLSDHTDNADNDDSTANTDQSNNINTGKYAIEPIYAKMLDCSLKGAYHIPPWSEHIVSPAVCSAAVLVTYEGKPNNVMMVCLGPQALTISDFILVRMVSLHGKLTKFDQDNGTPNAMTPNLVPAAGNIDQFIRGDENPGVGWISMLRWFVDRGFFYPDGIEEDIKEGIKKDWMKRIDELEKWVKGVDESWKLDVVPDMQDLSLLKRMLDTD